MFTIDFNNTVINSDMDEIYSRIGKNAFEEKTFLITGATGMIPSYIVAYLIYLNEQYGANIIIYILVRDSKKVIKRFRIFANKHYLHIMEGNVVNPVQLDVEVDYVIHAASIASAKWYLTNPVEVMLPNIVGTYNLLENFKNKRITKFLFLSSRSVYGHYDGTPDERTITLFDHLSPVSCYSESKRCGETLCYSYFKEYGMPTVVARVAHTFGPTLNLDNDNRVFCEFLKGALEKGEIVINSDGKQKRTFCYISDAVTMFLGLLINGTNGEVYNVCNPLQYISINDFANIFKQVLPGTIIVHNIDKQDYLKIGPNNTIFNIDKISKLGWEPRITAYEAVRRTIMANTDQVYFKINETFDN